MTQLVRTPMISIEITAFAHATEDPTKVVEAIKQTLPTDYTEAIDFQKTNLKGHYGNPIALFKTEMKEDELMDAFVNTLLSRMSIKDREKLLREVDLHVKKNSLYLRLDKQAAACGEIRLCTKDPIRVRIRLRKGNIRYILEACGESGMSS